ncbi:hypothetical protein SAMN05444274_104305 [Mariniphaga anaerophila]|uniref:Outer membrane protein beta-barrel domain-containing protein n=1 Tax=Mariniphaga anaerophila TaxID=1484053 RepID=A0A1M5AFS2_9BACT|nr:hypothetical protein [Mariniphaga anaerophila]SHF28956.1 hypothetical protein SAMN05444274_104305 [Mariniphaga anaerophila]
MSKRIVLSLFVLFLAFSLSAQNTTFNKGDKVLNLGIGFGSTLYSGSHYTSKIPPISASFEVGVKDELFDENSSLGVGGYLGYTGAKWEYMNYGWDYSSVIVGARGALHYQFVDKLDTYTGLMLGYNVVSSKAHGTAGTYANSVGSGFAFSWILGGRYYFNDNLAGLLELGYGVAYLNLGIALKL